MTYTQAPAQPTIIHIGELADYAGRHLGYSDWHEVTQERIDAFADATGDLQWIHVDPVRARTGPFGGTIAHGYLTLSMVSMLLWEVLEVEGAQLIINYGLDKVRFPAPVPVGSRVRAGVECRSVEPIRGGSQATLRMTIEIEDGPKPACVADILFRYYG
jgi:acyl dehydratase